MIRDDVKVRIVHICSYYIGNKLYENLIKELCLAGVKQEVFVPIKNKLDSGKNQLPPDFESVNYHYKNILKKHDRILFHNKINKQLREIEKSVKGIEDVNFIHAHTVFSDGGTAYKLYKKYKIKYLVTVRNTDINIFYKYGLHLRAFMYQVLLNAQVVVFISEAYKQKMLELLPQHIVSKISSKCYVIPNGIEDYWHENAISKSEIEEIRTIRLLFIGKIDKNKNLTSVIHACSKLHKEGYQFFLNVIGNGPLEEECIQLSRTLEIDKSVKFHGYLKDRELISKIMDKSDILVMPSYRETFGLVYIEAMSRGLPVIYTKGQGIDGFFAEGAVGFSVDPNYQHMIVDSIKKITKSYREISINCYKNSKKFKWSTISQKYVTIYKANGITIGESGGKEEN